MRRIAVISGDGIGPEVTREAVRTLEEFQLDLSFQEFPHLSADGYLSRGVALPEEDLEEIRRSTAILFGAIGDPRVTTLDYARGLLLRLRRELDLYLNLRPARLFHEALSPLRDPARRAIDCLVVRENTEGLYTGIGGSFRTGTAAEVAIDEDLSTYAGTMRVLDYAFSIARSGVCMVDKSNVVRFGGGLWQRCWKEIRKQYPSVPTAHLFVDTAAMKLVEDPTAFDVVVTNNSYGDILSDLAAQLAGGLGTAASANINPEEGRGLFEPVHGTAPDIAGRGIANPVGSILSAAMMLRHLGHEPQARALEEAVRATLERGECTPDLGGSLSTEEAGEAVRAAVRA